MGKGVGGFDLTSPSFSRILGFFFNLSRPLTTHLFSSMHVLNIYSGNTIRPCMRQPH